MALATLTRRFSTASATTELVADFLLQREGEDGLRGVAYLLRTNVHEHV